MRHVLLKHARDVITSRLNGLNWRDQWNGAATRPSKGCFVSLKIGPRLRGCIGTLEPVRPSLEEEIASNALAASKREPRFSPVMLKEMETIAISIDILESPEPVESPDALDPTRDGAVVRSGKKCGVLLPGLPGVVSVEKQLKICLEKAEIEDGEPYSISRFTVTRYEE